MNLTSNILEQKYVKDSYNKIAPEFSRTRGYMWSGIKNYLNDLPKYSIIADIGCGNGKNSLYRNDILSIPIDLSINLCKISKNRGLSVILSNNLNIPLRTNSVDHTISVAVIHHLSTIERRIQAINELVRITKPYGTIFIQVWAFEQPTTSKRVFKSQDEMVSWVNKKIIIDR